MSEQARQNLAAPTSDKDPKADAKRKMTSAILEDENKKKDVYEFLEDDDDFEEFDIENEFQIQLIYHQNTIFECQEGVWGLVYTDNMERIRNNSKNSHQIQISKINNDGAADDQMMIEAHFNEDVDRKLWQEDWDDEEVDEDFAKQLRSQIRK